LIKFASIMLSDSPTKSLNLFLILAAVLFLPAYLINLGMVQLIRDEAIRALVSFEMIQSGDYITPTIGGVPYLKKPPLFNWILVLFFGVTGSYSEVVMRLPVILSILGFSATIYYFVRPETDMRVALVSALAFATCGRVIFYESLHGLIDVTFSWITYTFFMVSRNLFRREKFLLLFLVGYFLAGLSYLLKGLPSLFFTAATLLILFIQGKKFLTLLNWRHFAGILLFLLMVGAYYLLFFLRNPIEPGQVWEVLSGEVTRRTVVEKGIWKTLLNFLTYPFENIYHFLPWSLLVLVLFVKDSFRRIRRHPFLWYSLLLFIVNIIPYWTSPEGYPRYILMLVPLAFTILISLYYDYLQENHSITKWIGIIFGIFISAAGLTGFLFLFHPATQGLPYVVPVAIVLFVSLGTISYLYWQQIQNRLLWLAFGALVFRIAFDLTIIPSWKTNHPAVVVRQKADEVTEIVKDGKLNVFWNPSFPPDPYFQYRYNNEIFTWYLSVNLGQMISVEDTPVPGTFYLAKPDQLEGYDYSQIRRLEMPMQVPVELVVFSY
jgi:4-amino-4-deoxy-L-arabinose transferase-like glycosyltransferase